MYKIIYNDNVIDVVKDLKYLRYLENGLRNAFDFSGTPIKISLKAKAGQEDK